MFSDWLCEKLFRENIVLKVHQKNTRMKTLNFLAIVLITSILITSCKEEENGTARQTTNTFTYSQDLRGSVGVKGELPLTELNLAYIIGTEPASNLTNAELQLANTYLEISGLNQITPPDSGAVVLEDFTIKVGSRQGVNLGNCSTDPQAVNEFAAGVQQSTNTIISLIQNVFNDVTSDNKNAKITVSFTPNVDISSSDNVLLKISFGGTYYYMEFE
jgi:hypothetical protein